MILKLLFDKGVIVYDGFRRVRYQWIANSEEFEKIDTDATWIESSVGLCKSVLIIGQREDVDKADFDDFSIKTNCTVYLLNNEGKTIERIN
jgi:hypothetical protein